MSKQYFPHPVKSFKIYRCPKCTFTSLSSEAFEKHIMDIPKGSNLFS